MILFSSFSAAPAFLLHDCSSLPLSNTHVWEAVVTMIADLNYALALLLLTVLLGSITIRGSHLSAGQTLAASACPLKQSMLSPSSPHCALVSLPLCAVDPSF